MPTQEHIQREVQNLVHLVNFDEVESQLHLASQVNQMMRLANQGRIRQTYDLAVSLIDAQKGTFSLLAAELGEPILLELVLELRDRGQPEEAIEEMKRWLERFPGHPVVSCALVDSFHSFSEEALSGVHGKEILNKVLEQHPRTLHAYLLVARRMVFINWLMRGQNLTQLVTHIWKGLRQMEWVIPPNRDNVRKTLSDLFMFSRFALNSRARRQRLDELVEQTSELLKPEERPLWTPEDYQWISAQWLPMVRRPTQREQEELLDSIDMQTVQDLLDDAEVYEQVKQWINKYRWHHVYRKLIPFERWAQRPLHGKFREQAILALSALSLQQPSRDVKLDDLLRYTEQWAELAPNDARPLVRKVILLIGKNDAAAALAVAEDALRLSPHGIEPPALVALILGANTQDIHKIFQSAQALQQAWRNLPLAQWIMHPHPAHVRETLRVLVGLTALIASRGGLRQEALRILDEGERLLGRNAPELQMARRRITGADEGW
ncbi:MAG: hypothetical protein KatS3mg022_0423 [Armatimonadota bacterium]|nr:MAG: hypothetical protein KatS3mg022_0423 [Armatimonadota bacterium]